MMNALEERQAQAGIGMKWHEERRHFEAKYSEVAVYKPYVRFGIKPEVKPDRPTGMKKVEQPERDQTDRRAESRHFPDRVQQRAQENFKLVDRKKVVFGDDGEPCRLRKPGAFDLEKSMGKKVRVQSLLDKRNGIEYNRLGDKLYGAAEYSLGYFDNSMWGGGVIPGSNFGFARATETTKESLKVFGKTLAELWNKSPQIPLVVKMCLSALEVPERVQDFTTVLRALGEFQESEDFVQEHLTLAGLKAGHGVLSNRYGRKRSLSGQPGNQDSSRPHSKEESRPGSHESSRSTARKSHELHHTARSRRSMGSSHIPEHVSEEAERQAILQRKKTIRVLRNKFDCGQTKDIDLRKEDIAVTLGLLLTFLKEMKQPLLTFELYNKLMQTQLEASPQARLDALRPTVAMLPPANEAVLFEIMRYINQLCKQNSGLMIKPLAQVVGPLILRDDPRKPTQAFLQDPVVQRSLCEGTVSCMFNNAETVFPASALRLHNANVHIPFALRRSLSLALDDLDSVVGLNEWDQPGNSDRSTSTDSSAESKSEEGKERNTLHEDVVETAQMEELEKILEGYQNRLSKK